MELLDGFDLKILSELQRDGHLTNNELSDASRCLLRNVRAGVRAWRRKASSPATRRRSTVRSWGSI